MREPEPIDASSLTGAACVRAVPLRIAGACLWLAGLLALTGCDSTPTETAKSAAVPGTQRLQVLATTGMIADAARQVGGDRVTVEALMGPGVDPHLYQPTAQVQSKLKLAQVVLYNGLHLEGKMVEFFESLASAKPVIAVSKDIAPKRLLAWSSSAGMHDPHIWFDVTLWQDVVRTIEKTFCELAPADAAYFHSQAASYLAELEKLDKYCRERAQELQPEQRLLITSHDAFHYFGRAYGFEVVGIQGISTDSEAGLKAITDASDLIKQRHLLAIFPESSVTRAAIERVAQDSGAALGPELYSDALGDPDSSAGTYAGMIKTNIDHIVDSLEGKAAKPHSSPPAPPP